MTARDDGLFLTREEAFQALFRNGHIFPDNLSGWTKGKNGSPPFHYAYCRKCQSMARIASAPGMRFEGKGKAFRERCEKTTFSRRG